MLVLLANLVWSLILKREPAGANPWRSKGLEWQIPSPPPRYNFETIPEITASPYGYGVPDVAPVAEPGRPVITGEGGGG